MPSQLNLHKLSPSHTKSLSWVSSLSPVSQGNLPTVGPTHPWHRRAVPRAPHHRSSCCAPRKEAGSLLAMALGSVILYMRLRPACPRCCSLDPVSSPPNPHSPLCSTLMPKLAGSHSALRTRTLFFLVMQHTAELFAFLCEEFWEAGLATLSRQWADPGMPQMGIEKLHTDSSSLSAPGTVVHS